MQKFNFFFLVVLNKEDPEWYWIVRSDGQEGFIPSGFVYPAENILQNQDKTLGSIPLSSNIMNSNSFPINVNIPAATGNILFSTNNVNNNNNLPLATNAAQPPVMGSEDLRYQTELVMLYDYKVSKLYIIIN